MVKLFELSIPIEGGKTMSRITFWLLTFISLILTQVTGCTLKGTTEEIIDTTSNITVSTSGRIWWNEDGLLNPEHKAIAFATYNPTNLEQDIARGQGEYLASLGSLLGVREGVRPAFEAAAQSQFQSLMPADHARRVEYLRALVE
jgi:hypothetical protein